MAADRRTLEKLLEGAWWLVVGLHLWAIWGVPVFVTQDGPSHLYSVSVFLQLLGENAPVLGQVFEINPRLVPNWLGSGILLALSSIFSLDVSEKALVSLYLLGFALGFRAVLRALDLQDPWGKFLVLPLLFNHYLFFGLYNYLIGLAGSVFLFAYGLRHLGSLNIKKVGALGAGFVVVYFAHLLPAALCGLALLVLLSFRLVWGPLSAKVWAKQLGLLAVAGAPAAGLFLWFLFSASGTQGVVWGRSVSSLLAESLTASFLVPFRGAALVWAVLCLVTVLVVSGWILAIKVRRRRWGFEDGFLFLGIGVFAFQLISPEGLQGGSLISYRLGIFLWLALLGWVLVQERLLEKVPFSGLLGGVFLMAGLCQPISVAQNLRQSQSVMDDLASVVSEVPNHSEVWPIVLDPFGRGPDARGFSARNSLFSHAALRSLASKEDVASRIAFQGEYHLFPIRFREEAATRFFLDGFDTHPESFPLTDQVAESWKGSHPAFLLVIGETLADLPVGSPLALFIKERADPVASVQGDLGPILLFRLKPQEAQPPGDAGSGEV